MTAYRRLSEIRTGKETCLWRGQHPATGWRVTVKEPATHVAAGDRPRVMSQLSREFKFLDQLDHPHIIRPVELDQPNSRLLLEDTQGTLAQLLVKNGRLEVDLVAQVMTQTLHSLQYLHDRKLGHGALSTFGIFLSPNGDVKLGDFVGYRYDTGNAPVPPDYPLKYRAPELIDGTIDPGPADQRAVRADLYTLGFVALELLSGSNFPKLFGDTGQDEDDANWLWWHGDLSLTLPPLEQVLTAVPGSMLDVLSGLIHKPPKERAYKTAADVLAVLGAARLVSNRKLPPLDAAPAPTSGVHASPPQPPSAAKPSPPAQRIPAPPTPSRLELGGEDGPPTALAAKPASKPAVKKTKVDRPLGKTALNLWPMPGPSAVHAVRFTMQTPGMAGRGNTCKLVVNDPDVSDKHCLFARNDSGNWWVYDLASRNGTFVNDIKMAAKRLEDGDQIKLGARSFKVEILEDPQDWIIDEVKNKFELVKQIHSGTMGDLFVARWAGFDGRPVAVRVFPLEFDDNPEDIARFLRGSEKGGELRHKNLVRLYRGGRSVARWRGRLAWWLAMEYAGGGSLRDKLEARQKPLPIHDVVRMGMDASDALAELADRSLVHRNINPSCVLFAEDGTVKLGDFFLLRSEVIETINQITQSGVPTGEYIFQSPEQFSGDAEPTPLSDIYSLGGCMYLALTKKLPFDGDQPLPQLIASIQNEGVESIRAINPSCPADLEEIVLRCLNKNPEDRPSTPQELKELLSKI